MLPQDIEPHAAAVGAPLVTRLREVYEQAQQMEVSSDMRACPSCCVPIERVVGCNHITHQCDPFTVTIFAFFVGPSSGYRKTCWWNISEAKASISLVKP